MSSILSVNPMIKKPIVGLVLISFASGCAGTDLEGYRDTSDACNSFRGTLAATEERFQERTQEWAAIGAVAAGLLGATAGALIGGNFQSAAIGGAAGALAGGGAGYLAGIRKETSDRDELLRSINNDAASDSQYVVQVRNAVQGLNECRLKEIATTRQQFEAGTISGEQARTQATAIQSRADEDNKLINTILGQVGNRLKVYADARSEVYDDLSGEVADDPLPSTEIENLTSEHEKLQEEQQVAEIRTKHELEALEALI
jgi:outer membrane lipoprotein SlyB